MMNNIIPIVKPDNYINAHDKSAKHYDVFLDENLGEPADYRDLLSVLFNACENDTIHLFINCNGGHLDTTVAIVEGLKYTAADTTAIILGACHSGASMIALFCHNVAVTDNSYMMIHTASFGSSIIAHFNLPSSIQFFLQNLFLRFDKLSLEYLIFLLVVLVLSWQHFPAPE